MLRFFATHDQGQTWSLDRWPPTAREHPQMRNSEESSLKPSNPLFSSLSGDGGAGTARKGLVWIKAASDSGRRHVAHLQLASETSGLGLLFEVSPWESRCEDCVCGLMLVRHFSAIRGMLYLSFSSGGGGDGRIRFRSFWLGWCFFFLSFRWVANLGLGRVVCPWLICWGLGPFWSRCLHFFRYRWWVIYQNWKGYRL